MRSLVRVGLRPSRTARVSFGVQLMLVFFWLLYGIFMLYSQSQTDDQNFLHYAFIGLALLYLLYILAQNTPLFGTQSSFEITNSYLVVKRGHFRTKLALPFEEMREIYLATSSIKVSMHDGSTHFIDLRQISRKRNINLIKEAIRKQASAHNVAFNESPLQA
ncbi:MAG: hypothetical protein LPJ89_07875 [Hymenobacteraceae bacterium]|nr:hypothetical protein [Hymenobacteraceae bacterium]